jgi:hypothetical protein
MRLGRTIIISAFALLVAAGFSYVGYHTLFPDPLTFQARLWRDLVRTKGRDAIAAQMANRFHMHPPGNHDHEYCLRYFTSAQWSEKNERKLAQQLFDEGLSTRLRGRLVEVVAKLTTEHEARYHALSPVQERYLLLLSNTRGLDRWILELNRERIIASLEALRESRRYKRQPSKAAISKKDMARIQELWKRHKLVMSSAWHVSLEIPLRDEITTKNINRVIAELKRFVDRHGRPPLSLDDLNLQPDLRTDGFGKSFQYELFPDTIRIISPGFDGLRGTQDDQIRGFSWSPW